MFTYLTLTDVTPSGSHTCYHSAARSHTVSPRHTLGGTSTASHSLQQVVSHLVPLSLSAHPVSHSVTHPLSTQYPTTEVTFDITHGTRSVPHTQKNAHGPTISVSVSPRHHWSHKLPSPPPHRVVAGAAAPCQGCFLLLCSSPQPLLVPLRISCCQGPRQAWPSLGHTAQAQEPASRRPGPLCPLTLAGPMGFSPASAHCPMPRAPRPGFPRRGACGQLGRS